MKILEGLLIRLSQADDRKTGLGYIRSMARPFSQHLVKLMVWHDSTGDQEHWIGEILDYIDDILDVRLTKNQKIKERDYYTYLFKPYFETKEQFTQVVNKWVRSFQEKSSKPYPRPYKSYDIDTLWDKLQEFQEKVLPLFTKENSQAQDFERELRKLTE